MNLPVKNIFLLLIICFVTFNVDGQSVGGIISGGGVTYCDTTSSGFVSLGFYTGSIIDWEFSTDGGATWSSTQSPVNTLNQQSYYHLTQTTCYRAIVQNGAFAPDTSTISCFTVYWPSVGGSVSGGGTFCTNSGSGTLNLSGNNGNVLFWQFSIDNGSSWTSVSDTTTSLNYTNVIQNTLYSAVVQNGSTCPSDTSSTASFTIDALTNAGTVLSSDSVCYGTNLGTLNLTGITGSVLTWISSSDNGLNWILVPNTTTTQNYSNLTTSTIYTAIVQNGTCPADTSASAEIKIIALPFVNAGNDTSIISGQSDTLNGSGGGTPLWAPAGELNNNTIFSPVASPVSTTTYTLTVTNSNGCINNDNVVITVLPPVFSGMISNLFTPNGDGINDAFYIQDVENFPDNEVYIYNIYGNEVFSKKGYKNDWHGTYNGSALPDGTYYYVLKLKDSEKITKGSVDIYRSK